jgi:hypothetical protein
VRNGKSRGLRGRRRIERADPRPLSRYRVRVTADADTPRQRVWWLPAIEARSAAEAVLVAKVRLVLEGTEERGADGTHGWGLMAVPEAWWELGAAAALERGEYPAEVQPSAWDEAVDRVLG